MINIFKYIAGQGLKPARAGRSHLDQQLCNAVALKGHGFSRAARIGKIEVALEAAEKGRMEGKLGLAGAEARSFSLACFGTTKVVP